MKVFYSDTHLEHQPPFEVFDGGKRTPYLENADRAVRILAALKNTSWAELSEPGDFGLDPIRAVHRADYLSFLASAWTEWLAAVPEAASSPEASVLLPATFALRRNPRVPGDVLGRAGYFQMDLSACIVAGTYRAALASANCALSAARSVLADSRPAFALCRPPGHHAGTDYAAGYCFINNAAVAAGYMSTHGKVAVLDIDYHAGNGTQDIFYDRADVFTISIHADPAFEYPHFIGYADELGSGAGAGFHRNLPLPSSTDDAHYLIALDEALGTLRDFSPRYLVLSLGVDTFAGDPLGKFEITRAGIAEIARRIATLALPTAIIMEGGYANDELGTNVITFLEAFK